jgi:hypothetical protein
VLPDWLPAVEFGGADPGIVFNDFSPRVGLTYDLQGDGRTILRANYARYYGQVGTGAIAGQINPLSAVTVRYPWADANGDKVAQTDEVVASTTPLRVTGNWDPTNPTFLGTTNTIDPDLRNDTTDEFIIGASREIGRGFAADINYIWRRYDNFNWERELGISSADYTAQQFTPTCTVGGARCDTVTYFVPNFQVSGVSVLENQPNFTRSFNGVEVTARKRLENHWMMNASFSYNSTIQHYGEGSFIDPTNIAQQDGFQYDYETSGSGIGNVFVNAKWMFKLSGMYQAPYAVNVSAFYNARQGYPFEQTVRVANRPNGAGSVDVLLDGVGENRLPNYQNLDFHVERPVKAGNVRLVPSLDVFNVMNANTVQAIRGTQNATNANQIQAVVAPRVIRFGVRISW